MAKIPQHFFKRIPEKFVRKFRDELLVFATLTVPNGRVWQVGLSSEEGKIWFLDGWNDFMEYHSIRVGYFLVFKHERSSKFHVLIFDTTCCEIQYPYNFKEPKNEQNCILLDEIGNEDYREISSFTNRNHGRDAAILGSSRSKHDCEIRSKKCRMEELVQTQETIHVSELKPGQSKKHKICNSQGNLHHRRHLSRDAENLYAPSPLAQERDLLVKRTKLKTTARSGKDKNPTQIKEKKELLALLEGKGIAFSRNYTVSSAKEGDKILSVAKSLKPQYPSFMIFLRQSHMRSGPVYLPAKFVNKYVSEGAKCIILQVPNERKWPV